MQMFSIHLTPVLEQFIALLHYCCTAEEENYQNRNASTELLVSAIQTQGWGWRVGKGEDEQITVKCKSICSG